MLRFKLLGEGTVFKASFRAGDSPQDALELVLSYADEALRLSLNTDAESRRVEADSGLFDPEEYTAVTISFSCRGTAFSAGLQVDTVSAGTLSITLPEAVTRAGTIQFGGAPPREIVPVAEVLSPKPDTVSLTEKSKDPVPSLTAILDEAVLAYRAVSKTVETPEESPEEELEKQPVTPTAVQKLKMTLEPKPAAGEKPEIVVGRQSEEPGTAAGKKPEIVVGRQSEEPGAAAGKKPETVAGKQPEEPAIAAGQKPVEVPKQETGETAAGQKAETTPEPKPLVTAGKQPEKPGPAVQKPEEVPEQRAGEAAPEQQPETTAENEPEEPGDTAEQNPEETTGEEEAPSKQTENSEPI
jgi:hypothetical protein